MRSLIGRTVSIAIVTLATALAAAPSHAQDDRPWATALPQNRLLWVINDTRVANGLAPLTPNGELTTAASYLVGDMFRMGRASHTDSAGRDVGQRLQLLGYPYTACGEIIGEAWGSSPDYLWTEKEMLNWWMNSPPHRANILNPNFTEIGVGVTTGSSGSPLTYHRYWCVVFGQR